MKNIFLGAAFLLSAAFSFGQNCTPEVITNGRLMSPSVDENIVQPDSIGEYEQVVTFVVPRDTTYLGNQAEIDHFKVLSIDGLPFNSSRRFLHQIKWSVSSSPACTR